MNLWGSFIANGLFSKLLDSLFFFQRANKQLSVLLGYDVAIQTQNHDLGFICGVDLLVLAFVEADILAYLGVAVCVLWKEGMETAPAA